MDDHHAAHLAAHLRESLATNEFAAAFDLVETVADLAPAEEGNFSRASMHTLIALVLRAEDQDQDHTPLVGLCAAADRSPDLDQDAVEYVLGAMALGYLVTHHHLPSGVDRARRALAAAFPSVAHLLTLNPGEVAQAARSLAADPTHPIGPILNGYLHHLDSTTETTVENQAGEFVHQASRALEADTPTAYAELLTALCALDKDTLIEVNGELAFVLAGWHASASRYHAWVDDQVWERLLLDLSRRPHVARGVLLSAVAVPHLIAVLLAATRHLTEAHEDQGCTCDPALPLELLAPAPYHITFMGCLLSAHIVTTYDFHGNPYH